MPQNYQRRAPTEEPPPNNRMRESLPANTISNSHAQMINNVPGAVQNSGGITALGNQFDSGGGPIYIGRCFNVIQGYY